MNNEEKKLEPVRLNVMCREAVQRIKPGLPKGVSTWFVSDVPDYYALPVDRDRIRQVMDYLLDDAARYTSEGHIILVLTERVQKDWLTFSVTATRDENAPAADLEACLAVMRQMHGYIWHDNKFLDGVRTYFDLPLFSHGR